MIIGFGAFRLTDIGMGGLPDLRWWMRLQQPFEVLKNQCKTTFLIFKQVLLLMYWSCDHLFLPKTGGETAQQESVKVFYVSLKLFEL